MGTELYFLVLLFIPAIIIYGIIDIIKAFRTNSPKSEEKPTQEKQDGTPHP